MCRVCDFYAKAFGSFSVSDGIELRSRHVTCQVRNLITCRVSGKLLYSPSNLTIKRNRRPAITANLRFESGLGHTLAWNPTWVILLTGWLSVFLSSCRTSSAYLPYDKCRHPDLVLRPFKEVLKPNSFSVTQSLSTFVSPQRCRIPGRRH